MMSLTLVLIVSTAAKEADDFCLKEVDFFNFFRLFGGFGIFFLLL